MIVGEPLEVCVYVTLHDAAPPLPDSEHDPPPEKLPELEELKLTVPVGVAGFAAVSVTVAVHVLALPGGTGSGEQPTPVCVESFATTSTVEPDAVKCALSPP